MELVPLIKSRAHRILRRLDNYHQTSDLAVIPLAREIEVSLADNEELIGYYINPEINHGKVVLVTTQAIHILADGWKRVAYKDIHNIDTPPPEEKHEMKAVRVDTNKGLVDIPVSGGHGRLRDSWPFLHFILRVTKDVQLSKDDT